MRNGVRFIHTADWQIGLRAHFILGDAGAVVRDARLRTLQRIGAIAREFKADFVLVAGDVFEDHGLKPETIRKALDAMSAIPAPVYLLPGNHDPLTPDALYRSERFRKECPKNVRVLDSREPVVVDGKNAVLLPCPLFERHELGDVTEHLTPDLGPPDHVRIGVAHGGIKERLEQFIEEEGLIHNPIPQDRAARARLDYLALGDWHGRLQIDDRTWYSGTPEATRFKERDPGAVLLVELGDPGDRPTVTVQEACTFRWKQHQFKVETEQELAALARFLDDHPNKDATLLELTLTGAITIDLQTRLERDVIARAKDRFRFVRVRDEALFTRPADDEWASLPSEGWLGHVVERLRKGIANQLPEDTQRALCLLYRLHKEAA